MAVKPNIITKKTRRSETDQVDFTFSIEDVRTSKSNIGRYRENAYEIFSSLPLPHTRMEAWRRTDLKNLYPERYYIHKCQEHIDIPAEISSQIRQSDATGTAIISPGTQEVKLNPQLKQQGVIFTDLATAEKEHPDLLGKILGQVIKADEGKFSALTGAFAQTGLFLFIPKNVTVTDPFESVFFTAGRNSALVTQIAVLIEEGASGTLIHTNKSLQDGNRKFHSGSVEVFVGKNANFEFIEFQEWDDKLWNFTHERAQVEQSGNLDWIIGALGSELSKNFVDLDLIGVGSTGRVSGISFTNNSQHFDIDTQQNHICPHTTSDLLFKGALADESRSVWQGMIYVEQGADKTDGYQTNRNLVLSSKARVDSIPGLEIKADDVRCSHGATIGNIDKEQVFYLNSRGLSQKDAEQLIIEGFFEPVIQRIPFDNIKKRFRAAINQKIHV